MGDTDIEIKVSGKKKSTWPALAVLLTLAQVVLTVVASIEANHVVTLPGGITSKVKGAMIDYPRKLMWILDTLPQEIENSEEILDIIEKYNNGETSFSDIKQIIQKFPKIAEILQHQTSALQEMKTNLDTRMLDTLISILVIVTFYALLIWLLQLLKKKDRDTLWSKLRKRTYRELHRIMHRKLIEKTLSEIEIRAILEDVINQVALWNEEKGLDEDSIKTIVDKFISGLTEKL